MSYQESIEAFAENLRRMDSLIDAKWKPYLWNMNKGLKALAEALQMDMNAIKAKIDRLERDSKPQE